MVLNSVIFCADVVLCEVRGNSVVVLNCVVFCHTAVMLLCEMFREAGEVIRCVGVCGVPVVIGTDDVLKSVGLVVGCDCTGLL